jgi:hypothetical protein
VLTDPAIGTPPDTAVELFNDSAGVKRVARMTRLLGTPWVSIGAAAGPRKEIRLTVAWELSWYQWAVDATNPHFPVRELGHGDELDELDLPAREWNARAATDGHIELGRIEEAA